MNTRILCVDDDANILAGYQRNLRKQFVLEAAHGGAEALRMFAEHDGYAVVVADMQMPSMNGVQLLSRIRAQWPETVRVMLTGNADQQTAVDAVNQGHIFRFLTKPCSPERLASMLTAALEQHRLITAERELLEKTLNGAVRLLGDVLSMMDPVAFGRGQSLRDLVRVFAAELNITSAWELEMAAMLSQVGWVTLPPTLVLKARSGISLHPAEKLLLARVPETGANLLANIPRLEGVARIVRYHAKNFDGSGAPQDKVRDEEIPMGARVLRLLDDLCQLEATGVNRQAALSQMQACQGIYDPLVMQAALKVFDVYLPEPITAAESTAEELALEGLQIGRALAQDIVAADGTVIAESGALLTAALIERVRNFAAASGLRAGAQVSPSEPAPTQ